jgi:hypothetical protein
MPAVRVVTVDDGRKIKYTDVSMESAPNSSSSSEPIQIALCAFFAVQTRSPCKCDGYQANAPGAFAFLMENRSRPPALWVQPINSDLWHTNCGQELRRELRYE